MSSNDHPTTPRLDVLGWVLVAVGTTAALGEVSISASNNRGTFWTVLAMALVAVAWFAPVVAALRSREPKLGRVHWLPLASFVLNSMAFMWSLSVGTDPRPAEPEPVIYRTMPQLVADFCPHLQEALDKTQHPKVLGFAYLGWDATEEEQKRLWSSLEPILVASGKGQDPTPHFRSAGFDSATCPAVMAWGTRDGALHVKDLGGEKPND